MKIEHGTRESWEALVEDAHKPVLVEFWAPWCVYCKRLSPVLDRLADKLGEEIPIVKVDVDKEPELEERFQVDVIPTLYLFQNGKQGDKLVAPPSQAALEHWLHAQLAD